MGMRPARTRWATGSSWSHDPSSYGNGWTKNGHARHDGTTARHETANGNETTAYAWHGPNGYGAPARDDESRNAPRNGTPTWHGRSSTKNGGYEAARDATWYWRSLTPPLSDIRLLNYHSITLIGELLITYLGQLLATELLKMTKLKLFTSN